MDLIGHLEVSPLILYSGGKDIHGTKEFNWVEIYKKDNCVPWEQTFLGVTSLKTWYLIWDEKAQLKLANLKMIEPNVPGTECLKFRSIEVIGNLVNFHFWKWNVWSEHWEQGAKYTMRPERLARPRLCGFFKDS